MQGTDTHCGKHHKTYVDNLNKFSVSTEFADMPLIAILRATAGRPDKASLNHKIDRAFGGVDACKKELSAAAVEEFGIG